MELLFKSNLKTQKYLIWKYQRNITFNADKKEEIKIKLKRNAILKCSLRMRINIIMQQITVISNFNQS